MLDWQSHRKLRIFIKVICIVLIATFVSYDLSWAGATEVLSFNNLASLSHSPFVPPTLKYLSVNEANPRNYFNFLLDKGHLSITDKWTLNKEAKQLINYFFLGITLPDDVFWVNLRPAESDRITSEQLTRTDLGRTLLEQDFRLKRDMSQYLNPQNPIGRQFWEKLYSTLGKDKVKKTGITTSNRIWIVPAEAVVVETEDGALLAKSSLKVLLESEYAVLKLTKQQPLSESSSGNSDSLKALTEQLIKEIVIPAITKDVNESQNYSPLRQIYHSLILAQWFKRKHKNANSAYAQAINKGYLKGLESQFPWEKQQIWQEYIKSYKQGEYKIQDTIFGLKRMYFSGGVLFDLGAASFPFTIISQKELPEVLKQNPDLLNSNSLKDSLVVLTERQGNQGDFQDQPLVQDINIVSSLGNLPEETALQQAEKEKTKLQEPMPSAEASSPIRSSFKNKLKKIFITTAIACVILFSHLQPAFAHYFKAIPESPTKVELNVEKWSPKKPVENTLGGAGLEIMRAEKSAGKKLQVSLYGKGGMVEKLQQAGGISNPNVVHPGQKIYIDVSQDARKILTPQETISEVQPPVVKPPEVKPPAPETKPSIPEVKSPEIKSPQVTPPQVVTPSVTIEAQKQMEGLQAEIKDLQASRDRLKQELSQLKGEKETLVPQVEQLQKEKEALEGQKSNLLKETDILKAQIEEAKKKVQQQPSLWERIPWQTKFLFGLLGLGVLILLLRQGIKIRQLKRQIEDLEAKLEESPKTTTPPPTSPPPPDSKILKELEDKITKARTFLESLESQKTALDEAIRNLDNQRQQKEKDFEALKEGSDSEREKLQKEIDGLRNQKVDLESKAGEIAERLGESQKQLKELEPLLNELNDARAERDALLAGKERLNNEITKLKEQQGELDRALQEGTKQLERIKREIEELKPYREVESKAQELEDLMARTRELIDQLDKIIAAANNIQDVEDEEKLIKLKEDYTQLTGQISENLDELSERAQAAISEAGGRITAQKARKQARESINNRVETELVPTDSQRKLEEIRDGILGDIDKSTNLTADDVGSLKENINNKFNSVVAERKAKAQGEAGDINAELVKINKESELAGLDALGQKLRDRVNKTFYLEVDEREQFISGIQSAVNARRAIIQEGLKQDFKESIRQMLISVLHEAESVEQLDTKSNEILAEIQQQIPAGVERDAFLQEIQAELAAVRKLLEDKAQFQLLNKRLQEIAQQLQTAVGKNKEEFENLQRRFEQTAKDLKEKTKAKIREDIEALNNLALENLVNDEVRRIKQFIEYVAGVTLINEAEKQELIGEVDSRVRKIKEEIREKQIEEALKQARRKDPEYMIQQLVDNITNENKNIWEILNVRYQLKDSKKYIESLLVELARKAGNEDLRKLIKELYDNLNQGGMIKEEGMVLKQEYEQFRARVKLSKDFDKTPTNISNGLSFNYNSRNFRLVLAPRDILDMIGGYISVDCTDPGFVQGETFMKYILNHIRSPGFLKFRLYRQTQRNEWEWVGNIYTAVARNKKNQPVLLIDALQLPSRDAGPFETDPRPNQSSLPFTDLQEATGVAEQVIERLIKYAQSSGFKEMWLGFISNFYGPNGGLVEYFRNKYADAFNAALPPLLKENISIPTSIKPTQSEDDYRGRLIELGIEPVGIDSNILDSFPRLDPWTWRGFAKIWLLEKESKINEIRNALPTLFKIHYSNSNNNEIYESLETRIINDESLGDVDKKSLISLAKEQLELTLRLRKAEAAKLEQEIIAGIKKGVEGSDISKLESFKDDSIIKVKISNYFEKEQRNRLLDEINNQFTNRINELQKPEEISDKTPAYPEPYAAILFDIDRTLTEVTANIEPEMLDQLLTLLERKVSIALITAQGINEVKKYIIDFVPEQRKPLLHNLTVYPGIGARAYQFDDKGNLIDMPLYSKVKGTIFDDNDKNKVEEIIRSKAPEARFDYRSGSFTIVGLRDRDKTKDELNSEFKRNNWNLTVVSAGRHTLYIMLKGINKGTAALHFAELVNQRFNTFVPQDKFLIIGDSFNTGSLDLDMLKALPEAKVISVEKAIKGIPRSEDIINKKGPNATLTILRDYILKGKTLFLGAILALFLILPNIDYAITGNYMPQGPQVETKLPSEPLMLQIPKHIPPSQIQTTIRHDIKYYRTEAGKFEEYKVTKPLSTQSSHVEEKIVIDNKNEKYPYGSDDSGKEYKKIDYYIRALALYRQASIDNDFHPSLAHFRGVTVTINAGAVNELVKIGKPAVSYLTDSIKHEANPYYSWGRGNKLAAIIAIAKIAENTNDANSWVAAYGASIAIGTEGEGLKNELIKEVIGNGVLSIKPLIQFLSDKNEAVRSEAVEALYKISKASIEYNKRIANELATKIVNWQYNNFEARSYYDDKRTDEQRKKDEVKKIEKEPIIILLNKNNDIKNSVIEQIKKDLFFEWGWHSKAKALRTIYENSPFWEKTKNYALSFVADIYVYILGILTLGLGIYLGILYKKHRKINAIYKQLLSYSNSEGIFGELSFRDRIRLRRTAKITAKKVDFDIDNMFKVLNEGLPTLPSEFKSKRLRLVADFVISLNKLGYNSENALQYGIGFLTKNTKNSEEFDEGVNILEAVYPVLHTYEASAKIKTISLSRFIAETSKNFVTFKMICKFSTGALNANINPEILSNIVKNVIKTSKDSKQISQRLDILLKARSFLDSSIVLSPYLFSIAEKSGPLLQQNILYINTADKSMFDVFGGLDEFGDIEIFKALADVAREIKNKKWQNVSSHDFIKSSWIKSKSKDQVIKILNIVQALIQNSILPTQLLIETAQKATSQGELNSLISSCKSTIVNFKNENLSFNINNPLHVDLEYITYVKIANQINSNSSYDSYIDIVNKFRSSTNPSSLTNQEYAEVKVAVYEAFKLLDFIRAIKNNSKRPIWVVANLTYGKFAISPILGELGKLGIEIHYAKIGSSECHNHPNYIKPTLFSDEEYARIMEEEPIIIVVDGTQHLLARPEERKSSRYPDAYIGYRNFIVVVNDVNQAKSEEFLDKVKINRDFLNSLKADQNYKELAEKLKKNSNENHLPYVLEFWNPGGLQLVVREAREEIQEILPFDPQKLDGSPMLIFINGVLMDDDVPQEIKDWAKLESPHTPAFYDDKDTIKATSFAINTIGIYLSHGLEYEVNKNTAEYKKLFYKESIEAKPQTQEFQPRTQPAIKPIYDAMIFDLDGTLTDTLKPAEQNLLNNLTVFLNAGTKIAIVTSQGFSEVKTNILDRLGEGSFLNNLFLYTSRGAQAFNFDSSGKPIALYDHSTDFTHEQWEDLKTAIQNLLGNEKAEILDRGVQITVHLNDKNKRNDFAEKIRGEVKDIVTKVSMPEMEIETMGKRTINILLKNMNKGVAVKHFMSLNQIEPKKAIIVGDQFGDNGSDRAMIVPDARIISVGDKDKNKIPQGVEAYSDQGWRSTNRLLTDIIHKSSSSPITSPEIGTDFNLILLSPLLAIGLIVSIKLLRAYKLYSKMSQSISFLKPFERIKLFIKTISIVPWFSLKSNDPYESLVRILPWLAQNTNDARLAEVSNVVAYFSKTKLNPQEILRYGATAISLKTNDRKKFIGSLKLIEQYAKLLMGKNFNAQLFLKGLMSVLNGSTKTIDEFNEAILLSINLLKSGYNPGPAYGMLPEITSHTNNFSEYRTALYALYKLTIEKFEPTTYLIKTLIAHDNSSIDKTISDWKDLSFNIRIGKVAFDVHNPLQVDLEYTRFRELVDRTLKQQHRYNYQEYLSIITNANKQASATGLNKTEKTEVKYAAYEALRLMQFISKVYKQAKIQGRNIWIVPNLSYGRFAVSPILEDLVAAGVEIHYARIGSTESHKNPQLIKPDLFDPKLYDRMINEKPIIIVVDGTQHLLARPKDRKSSRYPDAYVGYRNLIIVINDIISGNKENNFKNLVKVSGSLIVGLRKTHDYNTLKRRFLRVFKPVGKQELYSMDFWNPGGLDLVIRESRKETQFVKPFDANRVSDPMLIFVNSALLDDDIPRFVKREFGSEKIVHRPAYFDDTSHIQNILFDVDSRGVHLSDNLYKRLRDEYNKIKSVYEPSLTLDTKPSQSNLPFKIGIFDLDGTLTDTLTPISKTVLNKLLYLMQAGMHIALITVQSLDELKQNLINEVPKAQRPLLQNLILYPSTGGQALGFDNKGNFIPEFFYDASKTYLSSEQNSAWRQIIHAVLEETGLDLALTDLKGKTLAQPATVIDGHAQMVIRLNERRDLRDIILKKLYDEFTKANLPLVLKKMGRTSIRMNISGIDKKYAVEFHIKEIAKELGAEIDPKQILVVGNSFDENGDDRQMWIKDARVVSVGSMHMGNNLRKGIEFYPIKGWQGTSYLLSEIINAPKTQIIKTTPIEEINDKASYIAKKYPGMKIAVIGAADPTKEYFTDIGIELGKSLRIYMDDKKGYIFTGGVSGIGVDVYKGINMATKSMNQDDDRFFTLLPEDVSPDHGYKKISQNMRAEGIGRNMYDRRIGIAKIADVVIVLNGRGGTMHEAITALENSKRVIVLNYGGAGSLLYNAKRDNNVGKLASEGLKPEHLSNIILSDVDHIINSLKGDNLSSSAVSSSPINNHGGIDLSNIELTLKDERFVSSLNPADLKILRAARALKEGQESLAVLYVHEVRLILKDNILVEKDVTQRALLQNLLAQLEHRELLNPEAVEFCHVLQDQKILPEERLVISRIK